ncbi:MAG: outer membrane protein assembly factor BamB, partial [Candidatus Paceibacteria bacterium]
SLPTEMCATPVIANGLAVFGRTPDWLNPSVSEIVAVDIASGTIVWQASIPSTGPSTSNFAQPIAFRDGRVFVTRTGYPLTNEPVFALDASNGAILWTSQDTVTIQFNTSPTFAPNGDLIMNGEFVGSFLGYRFVRIDAATGNTVWSTFNGTVEEESSGLVVGGKLYGYGPFGDRVRRFDINSGDLLYESGPVAQPGLGSSSGIFSSPDGTIFMPNTDLTSSTGTLAAYEDTGSSFNLLWESPMRPVFWSSYGVGPDGNVYNYAPDGSIVRLAPDSGIVLAASSPLPLNYTVARMAIDAQGKLFVTASENGPGQNLLIALDANLQVLWTEALLPGPTGGTALASDGTVIVSSQASGLRGFRNPTGDCSKIRYCGALANSSGMPARLDINGVASASFGSFTLVCEQLPKSAMALFFFGPQAIDPGTPFGNGLRCVDGALELLGVQTVSAGGLQLLQSISGPHYAGVQPGDQLHYQLIYRDTAAGGAGFNTSDAMRVQVCD